MAKKYLTRIAFYIEPNPFGYSIIIRNPINNTDDVIFADTSFTFDDFINRYIEIRNKNNSILEQVEMF